MFTRTIVNSFGMTESQVFAPISKKHKADVFFFSATVDDRNVDDLIKEVRKIKTRKDNCVLVLTTNGGDPDAGYRMARMIKNKYKKFILLIFGACKSTGTLVALAANEIVMGDFAEFGPLDIQLTKDDELTNTSGLSYLQSLISLNERIFTSFEENFMALKKRSGYAITTKTAAEIGSKLAVGIIQPIAGQIDPLKLGEVQRAISIASSYGERICGDKNRVKRLIGDYPSHSFVIDFNETKELFNRGGTVVREPDDDEQKIEENYFDLVRREGSKDIVLYVEIDEADITGDAGLKDDNEAPVKDVEDGQLNLKTEKNNIENDPAEIHSITTAVPTNGQAVE